MIDLNKEKIPEIEAEEEINNILEIKSLNANAQIREMLIITSIFALSIAFSIAFFNHIKNNHIGNEKTIQLHQEILQNSLGNINEYAKEMNLDTMSFKNEFNTLQRKVSEKDIDINVVNDIQRLTEEVSNLKEIQDSKKTVSDNVMTDVVNAPDIDNLKNKFQTFEKNRARENEEATIVSLPFNRKLHDAIIYSIESQNKTSEVTTDKSIYDDSDNKLNQKIDDKYQQLSIKLNDIIQQRAQKQENETEDEVIAHIQDLKLQLKSEKQKLVNIYQKDIN